MKEVQARGERIIRQDVLAQKYKLSLRQQAALDYTLEHGELSIKDFAMLYPGISRRTLQRELVAMVKSELLAPEGATNRLVYRLGKVSRPAF